MPSRASQCETVSQEGDMTPCRWLQQQRRSRDNEPHESDTAGTAASHFWLVRYGYTVPLLRFTGMDRLSGQWGGCGCNSCLAGASSRKAPSEAPRQGTSGQRVSLRPCRFACGSCGRWGGRTMSATSAPLRPLRTPTRRPLPHCLGASSAVVRIGCCVRHHEAHDRHPATGSRHTTRIE